MCSLLVNCSNGGLTSIPSNIPVRTTHLSLDGNILHNISSNAFRNLGNLRWLELSASHIYNLESGAFNNLWKLNFLGLKNNYLSEKNGSYAQGVFSPVARTLQVLDISGNLRNISNNKLSYPSKFLSVLHFLRVLKLDCISGKKLDNEFKNVSSLKELDFSNGIQTEYIPDDMFYSLHDLNVEKFNLSNLNISTISGAVFSKLASLRVLDLSNNPRLVYNVVDVAHGLRNTSIEELYMSNACLGIKNVLEEVLAYLKGANIKVLALDQNEIHTITNLFPGFLT